MQARRGTRHLATQQHCVAETNKGASRIPIFLLRGVPFYNSTIQDPKPYSNY